MAPTNLTDLTSYINSLNVAGQTAANQARIPGEAGLETQSSGLIGQELSGQLPEDVIRQLQQQGAERGVATGTAGSPNNNAAYLQALGLNSLQLEQTGESNLTAAEGRNPAAPIYNPATQLMTPEQSAQLGLQQESLGLQAQSEADRVALQEQEMAQQAALASAAGARAGGGTGTPAPALSSSGGPPGLTGSDVLGSPEFSTADWWSSIGYGQPAVAGQPGYSAAPAGTTTTDTASYAPGALPGTDWTSLFQGGQMPDEDLSVLAGG